jgi:hypothetical protein
MNKIIDFMNWLTDIDGGWWPLLKCRPNKNEYIDSKVLAKITPFFGTLTGIIIVFLSKSYNDPSHVAISIALGWLSFFILYRITFSVAWNIRADMLNNNVD